MEELFDYEKYERIQTIGINFNLNHSVVKL